MSKDDLEELEDDDIMIGKIKNEIFDLNKPELFPKLFTDEEFLEIQRNEAITEGIEKGMKKGIKKGMKKGIEQGIEQGIIKGIEQGIIKGIEQTNINNARSMKVKGFSVKDIFEITNLDIKTIESL